MCVYPAHLPDDPSDVRRAHEQTTVCVYGARVMTPDVPAELYVTIGALSLAHALPADVALLLRGGAVPGGPLVL